jgi:flagellar hook assembly protein FlgD
MSQQNQPMHNASIVVFPNPFTERLNIAFQAASQNKAELKIYDVTGRLVKQFGLPSRESLSNIIWDGIDDRGRAVPQGVYFLRVDNPASGDMLCQKVLKVK